jgi:hypothetical protein
MYCTFVPHITNLSISRPVVAKLKLLSRIRGCKCFFLGQKDVNAVKKKKG